MLGLYAQHAQTYLLVLMIGTTLFFALPIFIAPLAWARLMLWRIPQDTDLAVYFGRCLGAFILIVEFLMLRGATTVETTAYAFDVLFCVFGLMLAVHVYGAIRRIQPLTETLEIGFWALLLLLNTRFYPAFPV
ncbi:hypothetical protein FW320_11465 [Azospirillum sp. Vi22]|uniref:hypothetical protein n=1 Tax=Azospirillum baldaniorum TaxID=1064539 RepID=UPI00157B2EC6|nr:hypothetical protein [Azospirillum baldaniorum]NUB06790.1 hypothetical protein [Azospirillum baldaniorum]